MLRLILVICACAHFVAAGRSPHADYIDELMKSDDFYSRHSNNVFEDARLDVVSKRFYLFVHVFHHPQTRIGPAWSKYGPKTPNGEGMHLGRPMTSCGLTQADDYDDAWFQPELVRKYNYPLEVHTVRTSDGYILQMHRIPYGRDLNNRPEPKKPAVFLMHGLLSSSADWIIMGPGTSFGYMLAEQGFDVWMGNARGNYYSRRHVRLNPDSKLSTRFWEFSWDEIGNIDLPAMIDYALAYTGNDKLHYVGHSQGTTAFFVMASLQPKYNEKIISMHAFAPVAFMAHNQNRLFNALAPHANNIESLASLIGIGEFMPNNVIMTWAGAAFCSDASISQKICSNVMFLIGGWNEDQHNATMLPAILGHAPAGAALRQFAHYGQSIVEKGFRRYDHGWLTNLRKYGSRRPPNYDLSNIVVPTFLHYSDNDPLAHVEDVERLYSELSNGIKMRLPMEMFSHLDFVWG